MQEPMPEQPMPEEPEMEEPESDENDPAFLAAIEFVKSALYESGAADQVNAVLQKSQDPVDEMANLAYELVAIADEKTEGEVPDDLLILLASTVLSEVAEIAEASGVELQASDIASALKMMILRFVGEQGHDTRALHEAMNQISPEQINQMAAEGDEMPPEQAQQQPQEVM
jgi:hypothetical protein